jgi:SHS2 domain-containing protein
MEETEHWDPEKRDEAYAERDHPADILLEVWGTDLPTLFENALFALYDQLAELTTFQTACLESIKVEAAEPAQALRSLLSEALYHFHSTRFVAAQAKVTIEQTGPHLAVTADLRGERANPDRHVLLSEVKAVTYHQLSVSQTPDGNWTATVLFDV